MVLKIAEDILLCFATLVLNCVVNLPLNLFGWGLLLREDGIFFCEIELWSFNLIVQNKSTFKLVKKIVASSTCTYFD